MSAREMFFTMLQTKLYAELKQSILRDWRADTIWNIVRQAVNENEAEIIQYLNQRQVTLSNMEQAADDLVYQVLLPYIQNMRV